MIYWQQNMNLVAFDNHTPAKMLLVEKVHFSFETWFVRQFRMGLIENDQRFTLEEKRKEYLSMCWREEYLWSSWRNNVTHEKQ